MLKDLLEFIRPPEGPSPRDLRRWQWNIVLIILCFAALCMWAVSPWGFATASDVDEKVEGSATPIRAEISSMKAEQQSQRSVLEQTRQIVINSQAIDFEARIVEFKTRMCKAQTEEAVSTWRLIVIDYQSRYLALTGRAFSTPSCADL